MKKMRDFPDCGTGIGEPQRSDNEPSAVCGSRRSTCECDGHDSAKSAGTGDLPEGRPFFKCCQCGGEELDVIRHFVRSTFTEVTVPCGCGEAVIAAMRLDRHDELVEQVGSLDDCHQFEFDAPEQLDDLGFEEEEYEVNCPSCAENDDETCWEIYQNEIEGTDEEYFVRCHGCGREIEFGWSHPERAGRIWPAECSDFNPWKGVPEPRFTESWHKKGWLRPIPAKDVAQSLGCSVSEAEELILSGKLARHPKSRDVATDCFALAQYGEDN